MPRRRVVLLAALAAAVAAVGVLVVLGGGGGDEPGADHVGGLTYRPLDDSDGSGSTGGELALAAYEGTPLVVNFFAAWCAPCTTEMPAFERVHQRYGDDVAFLGISVNETVDEAKGLVEQTGITWDLGRDPRGELLRALGGIGMPTTVLVRADGAIADVHTGELDEDELTAKIEDELLS